MASMWEVVGGVDKGGIMVRQGQDLKSPALAERLSTGALVEQVSLKGDRLQYRLSKGTGPEEGWISIKISGKDLAVPRPAEAGAPSKEPVVTKIKDAAPWLKPVFKAPPKARLRLVMFTWTGNRGGAGSAHDFRTWDKWVSEDCPEHTWEVCKVEYPGRGTRVKDPSAKEAREVAQAVVAALDKAGPLAGTVLFGFSFGAVLAYETAVLLSERGAPPRGLVVASAEHPGWTDRSKGAGPAGAATKDMDEADFVAMLHQKGGTEFILQDENMKKMFLPVIRADMALEEQYGSASPAHPPLTCPIVAYRGKDCLQVTRDAAEPWLKRTSEDGGISRIEELATGLSPTAQAPWLSDWYLCQGEASAQAMAKAIAKDFGSA